MIAKRPGGYVASYLKRQILRLCGIAQWSPVTPGGLIVLRWLGAIAD